MAIIITRDINVQLLISILKLLNNKEESNIIINNFSRLVPNQKDNSKLTDFTKTKKKGIREVLRKIFKKIHQIKDIRKAQKKHKLKEKKNYKLFRKYIRIDT